MHTIPFNTALGEPLSSNFYTANIHPGMFNFTQESPCFCCAPFSAANLAAASRAAPSRAAPGKSNSAAKGSSKSGAKAKPKAPSGPRRIDTHHHYYPPKYLAESSKYHDGTVSYAPPWSPALSLADMDKGGVETSILSISAPGVWFGNNAKARVQARECNEYGAQMVCDYPGRFGLFASLPLPDVAGALKEIDYAFDTLKADGVVLMTNVNDKWLGDPLFAPVFAELNRRKAVVYTHPTVSSFCQNLLPGVPGSMIEFGTDTTRTMASLLFSGTASRCPNIKFLFSHAGGTMPFITERFTRLAVRKDLAAKLPKGVMHELKRFFYDTAQAAHPMALNSLRELVSVSQIIFGTDYPYRSAQETARGIQKCEFSAKELQSIDRGNAARLFPRLKK
ncbi:MAG: amidohydrolase family protein [Burkholderiales bacterium]